MRASVLFMTGIFSLILASQARAFDEKTCYPKLRKYVSDLRGGEATNSTGRIDDIARVPNEKKAPKTYVAVLRSYSQRGLCAYVDHVSFDDNCEVTTREFTGCCPDSRSDKYNDPVLNRAISYDMDKKKCNRLLAAFANRPPPQPKACNPACEAGKICQDGYCVTDDSGSAKAAAGSQ